MGRLVAWTLALVLAQALPVFHWVDARGDLHVTDRLSDVPEPYFSMYTAKLRAIEEARAQGAATPVASEAVESPPSAPVATSAAPSVVDDVIARRRYWKSHVGEWRRELDRATSALQQATVELEQAELNPILRVTPNQQATIELARKNQQAALVRVAKARDMLLVDIPKRARAEHVPPKWLE